MLNPSKIPHSFNYPENEHGRMTTPSRKIRQYAARKELGRKPGAMPGGINRKTRERLKSFPRGGKKAEMERVFLRLEEKFRDHLKTNPTLEGKINQCLDRIHVTKPAERRIVQLVSTRVSQEAKLIRFQLTGIRLLKESNAERIKGVLDGTIKLPSRYAKTNSKGEYIRTFDQSAHLGRLEKKMMGELRALISNPPTEFVQLFRGAAKGYWNQVREEIFD